MAQVVNVTCTNDRTDLSLNITGCQVVVRNPGKSYLQFFCTNCRLYQTVELADAQVGPLRDIGVKLIVLDVPDEVAEKHAGGPITAIEIAEFAMELWSADKLIMPAPRHPFQPGGKRR